MHNFLKFGRLLSDVSAISSLYLRLSYYGVSNSDFGIESVEHSVLWYALQEGQRSLVHTVFTIDPID